jgi:hypothetical protein
LFGFDFDRLRSGPFEGPAIVKPPALPGDTYYRDGKRRWNRDIIAGGSMAHLLSITNCFNDIWIRDFTDYRKISMEPLK